MILCSCNVLCDRAVRDALACPNPPRTPGQVHRHLGCRAQCGRCARSMREIIDEAKQAPEAMEELEAKVA
ncbi:MAG: bacterioferritin-associated ferredoxin [Rhodomicrobium sp.]